MCEIVGIWGDVEKSKIQSMTDALRHRGSDGHGMPVQFNQKEPDHLKLRVLSTDSKR